MQPYSFPKALADVGAVGEEGHPTSGQPFYRLTGATVRSRACMPGTASTPRQTCRARAAVLPWRE